MATDQDFVDFVLDQLRDVRSVSARKMFGEYALYCEGKVVALLCDNDVFVKKTREGELFIGHENIVEAPAYSGAKPSFLITDRVEDQDWFSELIRITMEALPEPKPKKKT